MNVDQTLLRTVKQAPGLSLYELGKLLDWSNGKVDGSLRRLINSKRILVNVVQRSGRNVNLVYLRTMRPHDIIDVPKSLLRLGNPTWKDNGFIYALDSTTIGITGTPNSEWGDLACFRERVKLTNEQNRFTIKLPKRFVDFYHLGDKHITKTVNANNVLLTIDGRMVTSKQYPAK